ncbi:MAG: putative ABC exporter domain-containing protein, partial [Fimbriimonas sp.]
MKPLVFLYTRTILNGIKRAFSSGRRLIGLLGFISWYVFAFIRPFERSSSTTIPVPAGTPTFEFPPHQIVEAIVFGLFMLASAILTMGVLSYRGGFRPADVDVLFPTPVSPKTVLIFRMLRDYLLTLFLPAFLLIIGFRPASMGIEAFFRNFPTYGAYIGKFGSVAWFLLAIAWVSVGYAASLFVNRSDVDSDRNAKIITGSLVGTLLLVTAYIGVSFRAHPEYETFLQLAYSPVLRGVFGLGSLATMIVAGPLTGEWWQSAVGASGLVAVTLISFRIAMGQVGWMYDQAAAKGFATQTMKTMHTQGDTFGMMAEYARQGKVKQGRIAAFFSRWTTSGVNALVWRELVLTGRAGMWQLIIFVPMSLLMVGLSGFASREDSRGFAGILFLVMLAFSVFMMAMSSSTVGYLEMLRRVDLQKPLPFTSWETVLYEVIGKAVPSIAVGWISAIAGVAISFKLWPQAIAAVFLVPALAILMCAVVFLVIILFPDVDDPTQRSFRGLMTMLGLAIFLAPGIGVYVLGYAMLGPIAAAPVAAIV